MGVWKLSYISFHYYTRHFYWNISPCALTQSITMTCNTEKHF